RCLRSSIALAMGSVEEYDLKLKLLFELLFFLIRNWIGSVTDDEFYEACDKYGIMVWDDFRLE
uniref:hypothetical protein n=1 Tax=Klebsiella aerogenes TaxID=548 RepID=UPI00195328BF